MRRLVAGLVFVAALAAAWLLTGHRLPGAGPRRAKHVLLVTLDTTRADHLGCYGDAGARTPRIDALAKSGLRFDQVATVMPLTLPAHSSLMTATFPAHHGIRDNGGFYLAPEQLTLAEILGQNGFRTGGFVGAFVLDSRWGIAQGFDRYFDDFDLSKYQGFGMDAVQRRGDEVVDRALEWLAQDPDQPFFAWVHLYDPHTPYDSAPPEIRRQFPPGPVGAYDAELAWADSLVGRLLDALARDGRLGDTLVAVVGDHGESLGEHREQTHGFFVYDATTHIPWILSGPGVAPGVVKEQLRMVDVAPTILDLLGLAPPAAFQGESAMNVARGDAPGRLALVESWYPRYHYGWSELVAVRDGRHEFIRAPRPELYDTVADPGETQDLSGRLGEQATRLRDALEAMLEKVGEGGTDATPHALDAETAERLAALGYLGGGVSPRYLEDRPRGDPKDKIDLYNRLKKAGSASAEARLDDALELVDGVLAEDDGIIEAYTLKASVLAKAGRSEKSVEAFQRALAIDPDNQGALVGLAVVYKDMGRLDAAETGLRRALELEPESGRVMWQLADVRMRDHRFEAAEQMLRQALSGDVDRPRFELKLAECQVEMERFADAEKTLREVLRERPDQAGAQFTLGLALEGLGRPGDAIPAYEAELARDSKAHRAAFNLAKLLLAARRPGEAVQRFRQAIEAEPDFGVGYLYLAKALLDAGDLDGAERAARDGLDRQPERKLAPLGHYVLADVYSRRGRPADARREVAAARRLERGG